MSNKNLILAEARQKAEEQLAKLRTKTNRYVMLIVIVAIVASIPFSLGFAWVIPFPFNLVLCLIIPILVYINCKRHFRDCYLAQYEFTLQSLTKEPQSAEDYSDRAEALASYGFHESAVEDYRKALEMESNTVQNWLDLAETLWKIQQRDEALAIVEKWSEVEGDYQGLALVLQGNILTEEAPETALKCFDKAIEIEPNDSYCHLARLRFCLEQNQLDTAAAAIDETTKVLKKGGYYYVSEIYELRGMLAMKQGNLNDAVKEFNKAIRLESSEGRYYRLRSEAHDALGNLAKADADRRKADELASKS